MWHALGVRPATVPLCAGSRVPRATNNSTEDALSNLALIDILSTSNLSSDRRQLVDDDDDWRHADQNKWQLKIN